MLETIRELALEELAAAGEEQRIRARHASWLPRRRRGGRPEPPRQRPRGVARAGGRGAREPVRRADLERVRGRRPRDRAADRGRPCSRTGPRTASSTRAGASSRRCARAPREPTLGRARALAIAGWLEGIEGDAARCEPRLPREPGAPARGRGVVPRRSASTCSARWPGSTAGSRRRGSATSEALAVAAERDLWWPTALAWANIGTLCELEGRHREALESHERSVAIAHDGGDAWMTAMCMVNLGRAARHARDARAGDRAARRGAPRPSCGSTTPGASRSASTASRAWPPIAGTSSARPGCTAPRRRSGSGPGSCPWRTIQAEHDAGVRAASAALGEAAWAGAHAQGAALTEPEAIADALAFAAAEA